MATYTTQPVNQTFDDPTRTQGITDAYKSSYGRDPTSDELSNWYNDPGEVRDIGNYVGYQARIFNALKAQGRQPTSSQADEFARVYPQGTNDINLLEQRSYNPSAGDASFDVNRASALNEKPIDVYNQALEGLGISDARTTVQNYRNQIMNTQNLLNSLESDISGRTQNSLVTEGQRRKLLASEAQPLSGQLQQAQGGFQASYGAYGDILGEAKGQTQYQMEGEKIQRQALMERLQTAINSEQNVEKKRQWQSEYDRLVREDASQQVQRDRDYNLTKEQNDRAWALANQPPKAKASGGSSGGSSRSSGSSSGYPQDVSGISSMIKELRDTGQVGDSGYGSLASYLQEELGYNISRGSAADLALRKAYGFG